jgi:hypothetical protein
MKQETPFPNAGMHPIASAIFSSGIDYVRSATFTFAEKTLGLVRAVKTSK